MDVVNILRPYTMIALHFRDSALPLIAAPQPAGPGIRQTSADHPFTASGSRPCDTLLIALLLLIISATSIGSGVIQLTFT